MEDEVPSASWSWPSTPWCTRWLTRLYSSAAAASSLLLLRTSRITSFTRSAIRFTLPASSPTSSWEFSDSLCVRSPSATFATAPATAVTRRAMPRATASEARVVAAKATSPTRPRRSSRPRNRARAACWLRASDDFDPAAERHPVSTISSTPRHRQEDRALDSRAPPGRDRRREPTAGAAARGRPPSSNNASAPDWRCTAARKAVPSSLPETTKPTSRGPTFTGRATAR